MPRISIEAGQNHPTRNRRFQAPDPPWADHELAERIRQRLWKMDPRLNLWWNPHWKDDDPEHPGRWAIMYWLERQGCWSVVFYHESPDGSYRHLDPDTIDGLVRRLRACDQDAREAQKRVEAEAALRQQRERLSLTADLNAAFEDMRERAYGVRQTFGRGAGPRRLRRMRDSAVRGDLGNEVLRAHEKRRSEQHEAIRKKKLDEEFGKG